MHFASSVIGGSVGATLAVNANGLTINKGLQIGNTSGSNIVQMVADPTTNNQLNITGGISISNTQTYPLTNSQNLATIAYVNDAVGGGGGGDVFLAGNNAFTGNNTFSSPATSQTFNSQNVIANGGSVVLKTSASQYPITLLQIKAHLLLIMFYNFNQMYINTLELINFKYTIILVLLIWQQLIILD